MNWFRLAQYNPIVPIIISSYDYTYNILRVLYRGQGPYEYPDVSPHIYNKIQNLLRYRNYSAAKKILDRLSSSKVPEKETEEEKQEMLNELYERGFLD